MKKKLCLLAALILSLSSVGWHYELLSLGETGRAATRLLADLANMSIWDRQAGVLRRWKRIVGYALAKGHGAAIYATSDSAKKGQLAIAYYQTDTGTPSSTSAKTTWSPHVALVTGADTAHPRIREQRLSKLPNHRGGICKGEALVQLQPHRRLWRR